MELNSAGQFAPVFGGQYAPVFPATSVLPWFSRYYVGGFNRAQTITINRVEDRQYQIYLQIMKIVEQKS